LAVGRVDIEEVVAEGATAGGWIGVGAVGENERDATVARNNQGTDASDALVCAWHVFSAVGHISGHAVALGGVGVEARVADRAEEAEGGNGRAVRVKGETTAAVRVEVVGSTLTTDVGGRVIVQAVGCVAGYTVAGAEDEGRGTTGAVVLARTVGQAVGFGLDEACTITDVEARRAGNAGVIKPIGVNAVDIGDGQAGGRSIPAGVIQVATSQAETTIRKQAGRGPEPSLGYCLFLKFFAVVEVGEVLQATRNVLGKAMATMGVEAIVADQAGSSAVFFPAA
jgi:hypothetical protein